MQRELRGFLYRYRALVKAIWIILIIALGLGAFQFLIMLGPKPASDRSVVTTEIDHEKARQLLGKSREREQAFLDITALRQPSDADLRLLVEAIDLQEQYIAQMGGYNKEGSDRLEELERLFQNQKTIEMVQRSRELETEAQSLERQDKFQEALKMYAEALQLQRQINEDYPLSRDRNVSRLTQLDRMVQRLRGLPLWEKTMGLEKAANTAILDERWDDAKVAFREAILTQEELNMEYRGSQFANVQRLRGLEIELESLNSSDLHLEIEALLERAEQAESEMDFLVAAEAYQDALDKQRGLDEQFPQSRFAGGGKVDELEQLKQTAMSQDLAREILRQNDELDTALRDRDAWKAVELINALFQKSERFRESFPKSPLVDQELFLKFQYLRYMQKDLVAFQDRVYANILEVPEMPGVFLARIEVPQAFYISLMLNNPSRNRGERLPVDSLNWFEATEFCQKLSWVLARPVRLPTSDEYFTALGSLRYVDISDIAWAADSGTGQTQEVATKNANRNGFHDLLGNVKEWLSNPGEEADSRLVAGGSAEDSIDTLADRPAYPENDRVRRRMIGFRYVVEMQ